MPNKTRAVTRLPLRRVQVYGPSMAPTVRSGDVVLANFRRAPLPGDVVLAQWPELLCVKRAVRREGSRWWVVGDNPDASTDSRELGPAHVLGVITWRLWPRLGRIR